MLFYFLLWCAANDRQVPSQAELAREFGFKPGSLKQVMVKMRALGLITVYVRTIVMNRTIKCPAIVA